MEAWSCDRPSFYSYLLFLNWSLHQHTAANATWEYFQGISSHSLIRRGINNINQHENFFSETSFYLTWQPGQNMLACFVLKSYGLQNVCRKMPPFISSHPRHTRKQPGLIRNEMKLRCNLNGQLLLLIKSKPFEFVGYLHMLHVKIDAACKASAAKAKRIWVACQKYRRKKSSWHEMNLKVCLHFAKPLWLAVARHFICSRLQLFFFGETTKFLDVTCGVDGAIQHQNLHEKREEKWW